MPWPPHSPHLLTLVILLVDHMKQLVYQIPVNTVEKLTNQIEVVIVQIRVNPDLISKTKQQSLIKRTEACLTTGGPDFENLI